MMGKKPTPKLTRRTPADVFGPWQEFSLFLMELGRLPLEDRRRLTPLYKRLLDLACKD